MNFLAHFTLSCGTEERLIGNFLADFLRKHEQNELPEPYQSGIRLHYAIDAFTDKHATVQEGIRLLRPRHHKYAPVVLDVLMDYILAQNWDQYFPNENLTDFSQRMYRTLEGHLDIMPERLQSWVPEMIADDWLPAYGTYEGLEYTFHRMKRRVSKPQHLDGTVDSLEKHQDALTKNFHLFYPEILAFFERVMR